MFIDDHSQRLPGRRLTLSRSFAGTGLLLLVIALGFCSCQRREIPSPRIGAADTVETKETSHQPADPSEAPDSSDAANRAVRVEVVAVEEASAFSETETPKGRAFLIVETRWENVHPRQMVPKSKLEGKADRTMGVGAFARGGGGDEELVEVDVAYKVPKWLDHVYLLADGVAYPLHERSEEIPGGVAPAAALEISGQGEVVAASLLFLVPQAAENLALRLFDYSYGHVTVPVRGKERKAFGKGKLPRGALGEAATGELELATVSVDFAQEYRGQAAPAERRWAIAGLLGKSLSSGGGVGNIVEIDPRGYLWLATDGGFIHYAEPREVLRFTPEIYQHQEVAFLLPAGAERLALGARVGNQVVSLSLTDRAPRGMPDPTARHLDGGIMEIQLFGSRRDGELVILDLCVRPLAGARGLEIQPAAQFLLQAGASEARLDARATAALLHSPPEPFVVPPDTPVRFELAYRTRNTPDALRVRGFESEGRIEL
ncbi:MAG: hypothetical protein GY769_07120 [bacterium]|nr:hypothetical protein [bacterium]